MNKLQINLGHAGHSVQGGPPPVVVDGVAMRCTGFDVSAHLGEANVAVLHMTAPLLAMNLEAQVQRHVTDVMFNGVSYLQERTQQRLAQMRRLQWLKDYDHDQAARQAIR